MDERRAKPGKRVDRILPCVDLNLCSDGEIVHQAELLRYVTLLGKAFRGRGMDQHLRDLRVYYLALRHGLTSNKLEIRWSDAFVIEWMKTLCVPPFEKAYPLRPRGGACPRCPQGASPSICTDCVFPGGARMRCQTCGAQWLEDELPPWTQRRG